MSVNNVDMSICHHIHPPEFQQDPDTNMVLKSTNAGQSNHVAFIVLTVLLFFNLLVVCIVCILWL